MRGRPLGFWIAVAFAASAAGLALDKGFADNTPPYDEPLIAYIGFAAFLLCGAPSCCSAPSQPPAPCAAPAHGSAPESAQRDELLAETTRDNGRQLAAAVA